MDLITLAVANAEKIIPDTTPQFTATVVISGIGIVLAMLVLLIIIFQIFGAIMSKAATKNKDKKAKAKKVEDAPVIVESTTISSAKSNDSAVNGEIVAAISAAIYQLEGENAVITSITPAATPLPVRKQNPITCRNPWANSAIVENTMSF